MPETQITNSIQIVPASPSHWPALTRIIHRDLNMNPGQISYYLRHYMPGTAVALIDGQPVGCYVFYDIARSEVAWLGIIVVDGSIQSRGIGRQLIEHLERRVAADGYSVIEMSVDPANTRGQIFYERHGYSRMDRPGKSLTYAKPIIPTAPRRPRGFLAKLIHSFKCQTIWRIQYNLMLGKSRI